MGHINIGIVPLSHCIYSNGIDFTRNALSGDYLILMGILYLLGALVYVTRVPERWAPDVTLEENFNLEPSNEIEDNLGDDDNFSSKKNFETKRSEIVETTTKTVKVSTATPVVHTNTVVVTTTKTSSVEISTTASSEPIVESASTSQTSSTSVEESTVTSSVQTTSATPPVTPKDTTSITDDNTSTTDEITSTTSNENTTQSTVAETSTSTSTSSTTDDIVIVTETNAENTSSENLQTSKMTINAIPTVIQKLPSQSTDFGSQRTIQPDDNFSQKTSGLTSPQTVAISVSAIGVFLAIVGVWSVRNFTKPTRRRGEFHSGDRPSGYNSGGNLNSLPPPLLSHNSKNEISNLMLSQQKKHQEVLDFDSLTYKNTIPEQQNNIEYYQTNGNQSNPISYNSTVPGIPVNDYVQGSGYAFPSVEAQPHYFENTENNQLSQPFYFENGDENQLSQPPYFENNENSSTQQPLYFGNSDTQPNTYEEIEYRMTMPEPRYYNNNECYNPPLQQTPFYDQPIEEANNFVTYNTSDDTAGARKDLNGNIWYHH
ncbi:hypothetical protein HDU92_001357 [Lobulomyces angularis]|nr:hypothetical protein HDU92_001357 [Lobulomyces angularis]